MNLDKALQDLEKSITSYKPTTKVEHVGRVLSSADGVARIDGLQNAAAGELLKFESGVFGLALNLEEDAIGCIILGDPTDIKEGDVVSGTGRLLSIPVGDDILGRVVNPLGEALDGKRSISQKKFMPLEKIAPGVIEREPVDTPFQTGIKAIDAMVPVGRGQRELIIGDRGTGKTALALDSIINQAQTKTGIICIYVAIGQKASRVANVIDTLREHDALDTTVIVSADASMPASLQYLAPYAGVAIAEYFLEQGKESVVFYDDLSKHAWAYREVSLMLRRPSGREAYPGDIFYVHSRLLERAVKLNKEHGGGSITAFPFIETQAGDISAYIPTNVISITDGQIYLESDLFYSGIRPAINVGNSVSRVGGAAQVPIMKKVAGTLRIDLAQYRELAAFVQFATDLDAKTKERIDQGSRMVELLKQPQYDPLPFEEQVAVIFAGTSGMLNKIPVTAITEFEQEFRIYLKSHAKKLLTSIRKEKKLTDDIKDGLTKTVSEFLESWQPSEKSEDA